MTLEVAVVVELAEVIVAPAPRTADVSVAAAAVPASVRKAVRRVMD